MDVEKEVKKQEVKKKRDFYFTVLNLIKAEVPISHINEEGKEENSICSKLGYTKQALNYHISTLKKKDILIKMAYGVWKINPSLSEEDLKKLVKKEVKIKSSRGMKKKSLSKSSKPLTNLHALEIKFPILEGKIPDDDWEVKNQLNNWLPKYKGLSNLGGITLRNNNNKSVSVFLKARDIEDLNEVDNLCFKARTFITDYFKKKLDVSLDAFNCEVKNINLATEDKPCEGMTRKGEKFELKFNKQAGKIFPKDNIKSKAWIDGSPFNFTAETNDKDWKREYLKMPFSVGQIRQSVFLLEEYNRNLALHTKVQEEQLKTSKSTQKTLQLIQKFLSTNKGDTSTSN